MGILGLKSRTSSARSGYHGPMRLAGYLLLINLVAFATYHWDKRKAQQQGAWRVPEATLLAMLAAGGLVGSLLGQKTARHKTSKASFRVKFWAVAVLVYGGVAWWLGLGELLQGLR